MVEKHNVKTGSLAASMRYDFMDISEKEQKEKMYGAISGDFKTEVKLSSLSFSDFGIQHDRMESD